LKSAAQIGFGKLRGDGGGIGHLIAKHIITSPPD
jgi:hypothetical protein